MAKKSSSKVLTITAIIIIFATGYWWFNQRSGSKNLEQVHSELRTMTAGAQDYYLKPRMIGGGGKSFDGFTFEHIRVQNSERSSDNMVLTTRAAEYSIEEVRDDQLMIRADLKNNRGSIRAEIGSDSLYLHED